MSTLQAATSSRNGTFAFQVLAVFLPLALLTCGAAYYFYYSTQDWVAIHNRAREAVGVELGRSAISNVLLEIRRDLRLASEHYALKNFLDQPAPGELRDFEQDMLNLSSSSRWYDQIRWLDETGMERLRVNFNNGNPLITPIDELQNKRARYYFSAAFKLERGEAYISPLDLNIEHERIEIPHKPMLRIGTPVFDSHGDKRGIVLLNYFGAELLERFGKATVDIADHAMLLNQDGYWLKSPRADEVWGFMFGRDQLTLARRHPAAWQRILAADSGQFEDAEGLWTFKTIYPGLEGQKTPERNVLADRAVFWKIVAHMSPHALYGSHPLLKPILAALAALLLLQLAGCWKLAHVRRLRHEAETLVQHTNRNLERLVEERTAQLQADINLRKQVEERLHLQSAALEAAANAIVITDTEGFIQWANPAYFRLTGYTVEESRGKRPKDLIKSGVQDQAFWAVFWQTIKSGQVWRGEVINKRKDGVLYTEEMTVTPVRDEQGELAHFIAVKEDISARKNAEEALREKESMLSQSQRIAHVGTWQVDIPTWKVTWSAEVYRIYGITKEAFGHDWASFNVLILADDRAGMQEWTRACLAGEHPGELEFRAVRSDGGIRFLSSRCDLQYDTANRPVRMLGTVQDITERKQTEQHLVENERFLNTIIESEPECVKLLDAENRLLRMNSAGLKMIEADFEGQVIGENVLEIVAPEHRDSFAALTRRVFAGESGELEFKIIGLKGTHSWMDTHAVPLRDELGGISAYLAITRDITGRKRMEDALRDRELRLRLAQELGHVGVWDWCPATGEVNLSDEINRIYGLSPGMIQNYQDWLRRVHPDDVQRMEAERDAALKSREAFDLEFRIFHGSGEIRWISALGGAEFDATGQIARVVGINIDITERKQTEDKLCTLSTAVEQAPLLVIIADLEANILYVNPRFTEVTGYSADEVIGHNPRMLQSKLTPEEIYRDMWDTLTGGRVWHGEVINKRKNGEIYWEDTYIAPVANAAGAITHYVGMKLDITDRKQAEEHLHQASAVLESTREGVIVTDAEQRILRVNPAFCALTGYTEAEVLGKKPSLLSSGRQGRDFYAEMWDSLKATGHWQGEIWNRRKNGEVYPELLSISTITDDSGQPTGYVAVFADISKLKASEAELDFLAHHDPLTRLPNRLLLLSRLEHGVGLARRENRQLALLMLDLDRFKDVNDSFGHLAGDDLLQQAAERLTVRLRGVDTITRLGGDEFTVLLEDIAHPEDAARVAEEIIATLSEPWQLAHGIEVRIGVSIGISLFPQHGGSAAELLQQADAALYQAKADGRGRFSYFSEKLTRAARARIELEARLRRAIDQNELRVYYQPQVDIASDRITGAEALVRWQDPLEGLIPPNRFIPVAEATGLIGAVGEWVLKETCLQGRRWLEAGLPPLTLAVNVSPHQFLSGDLVEVVARTLAATGFPAAWLELELTESALMERQQEAVDTLSRLRATGVHLAIDDFGTGYSSLAYLKRFPLDVLKIDKSFVDDIPGSEDDKEIAAAIVVMAHTLRFKVLAEGVETVEQLAFLQGQGCDSYQGYLKSPPLPPDAFAKFLAESRLE